MIAAAITAAFLFARASQPPPVEPAEDGTVIWAVGDMCDNDDTPQPDCSAVADMIAADSDLDHFLMLGDGQYETGSAEDYDRYYHPKVGSKLNSFTLPVPGNHEYMTPDASGYYDYFGSRAGDPRHGYYAISSGAWRVVAVNSNCGKVGGCGPATRQGVWLQGQLARAETCELIFGHHPPITDGKYAPGIGSAINFHRIAYEGAAELLITGHDHNYQRFAPMDEALQPNPVRGVVNIVSGAGGKENVPWEQEARSAYRQNAMLGAVRIVLNASGYQGEFRAVDGAVMDEFSGGCH